MAITPALTLSRHPFPRSFHPRGASGQTPQERPDASFPLSATHRGAATHRCLATNDECIVLANWPCLLVLEGLSCLNASTWLPAARTLRRTSSSNRKSSWNLEDLRTGHRE